MSTEQSEEMMDETDRSGSQSDGGEGAAPMLTPMRMGVAVGVAAVVAWAGISFSPTFFTVPEEFLDVNMYSPPEQQEALAEKEIEIYWKNGLVYTTFLGLCFGIVPGILAFSAGLRKPAMPTVTGLVSGIVAGALLFGLGAGLRAFIDAGTDLPLIGDLSQTLIGDVLVLGLCGLLLGAPIAIGIAVARQPGAGQQAAAAPLAGLLAGVLVPVIASFAIPDQNTSEFPVTTPSLLAIWLGLFAVLVVAMTVTTGSRSRKPKQEPSATG